jgi:hypothetical protein
MSQLPVIRLSTVGRSRRLIDRRRLAPLNAAPTRPGFSNRDYLGTIGMGMFMTQELALPALGSFRCVRR